MKWRGKVIVGAVVLGAIAVAIGFWLRRSAPVSTPAVLAPQSAPAGEKMSAVTTVTGAQATIPDQQGAGAQNSSSALPAAVPPPAPIVGRTPTSAPSAASVSGNGASVVAQSETLLPMATQSQPPAASEAATPIDEETGTRRMVAAHAPLRTPEVANADSAANREILQSMVLKAISRAEAEKKAQGK